MGKIKKFLKKFGPGFVTGASDDDPSGIGTYSQTGAIFGYGHLWLTPFSYPFMVAIQETCGRIGLVTGKGLSSVLKQYYPKWILYLSVSLLLIANTINIAADLGAMAASAQMIAGLPFQFWIVFISVSIILLEIFVDYRHYSRILKFLSLSLFAYFFTAFISGQDWLLVLKDTFIPSLKLNEESMLNIVAFLGTSISPYLFFWQTSQEVEEEIVKQDYNIYDSIGPAVTREDIKDMRIDTAVGMGFSHLTAFMIVLTTAATLHMNGIVDIETAPQAAQALRPFAGDLAYLVFAMGILGTGLLGVPILAGSSAYAVAEAANWKRGLGLKLKEAPLFYSIIALSTLIGLAMNFIGINPMKALYYAAAVNGVMAPPLMVVILLIGRNGKVMGEHRSGKLSLFFGILGTLVMAVAAVFLLFNL
ncbi:MAG: putative family Mn2+/Fe2+ transporter [Firmicutes bacterium]|nr:putative family Mn2+/Fe2+ transporter [Bacillota bacterium]